MSTANSASRSSNTSTSANKLTKLGLVTDLDLVLHLPLRYEDETTLTAIRDLVAGISAQVEGVIADNQVKYQPRRQLLVTLVDENNDQLTLRFLNFYPSQIKQLSAGTRLRVRGEVREGFFELEMVHPAYRVVESGEPLPQALTPVYPSAAGISQTYLRRAIDQALKRVPLPEFWPAEVVHRWLTPLHLPTLAQSVRTLHHPGADEDKTALLEHHHPAWQRVKFEELLAQQLSLKRAHHERRKRGAPLMPRSALEAVSNDSTSLLADRCILPKARHADADSTTAPDQKEKDITPPNGECSSLLTRFERALPFTLTTAQQRAWAEISFDLSQPHPMQRLLQGDVGSGKTIVAALAAAQAIDAGYQVALMAPTELLAEQHVRKLQSWFAPLGVQVSWLAGGLGAKAKRTILGEISSGTAQLIIGTHALFQQTVEFARLGLVIVDEQHRFGVAQRLALATKAKNAAENSAESSTGQPEWQPHQLMMSATPIPRTLAMSYYADLDVSTIDMLPPGRTPVLTKLVNAQRRAEVIARVQQAALTGRQVYWVCPLIEESEALQLQTAVDTYETLAAALPELKVGLLHGRLNATEKAAVMEGFIQQQIQLLVATTVIEVGVDVPNASLMVIEHAERFGLAQLHQLRGRVGRGSAESVCLLLYAAPLSHAARDRLQIMRASNDGFAIAQRDLEIRGPGEFLGARQSGAVMLRFADLQKDDHLIKAAQQMADYLLKEHPAVVTQQLQRWFGHREDYLKV